MHLAVENKLNHFNSVRETGVSSNFCGNCINHKTEKKSLLMQVQSDFHIINITSLYHKFVVKLVKMFFFIFCVFLRC